MYNQLQLAKCGGSFGGFVAPYNLGGGGGGGGGGGVGGGGLP